MGFEDDSVISGWEKIQQDIWHNCSVPDCQWKVCIGLSTTKCFSHHFDLKMDDEGKPIFPDSKTRYKCMRLLREALDKLDRLQ